jgi:hypothetical protein
MNLETMTNRQLQIELVRRRMSEAAAEITRITHEVLPGMIRKQAARHAELARQEKLEALDTARSVANEISATMARMRD